MNKNVEKDFDLFRKSIGINANTMNDYVKSQNGLYLPNAGYINPHIIEERQLNVASMDVFSRLMMDRIIFLGTGIDDTVANIIVGQLLYMTSVDPKADIMIYVNSGGGGVHAGFGILDTMEFIPNNVNTTVIGIACSMAFVLSISGTKRYALKHSRLMQHQPSGGMGGVSKDMEISLKQILLLKEELYQVISDKTGQPIEKVHVDCDRDYWMTSQEALEYHAIDEIITKKDIKS
jgi:ATP-dependent Clp protease protease subunit